MRSSRSQPRVKVFSIAARKEGREMIAVAVSPKKSQAPRRKSRPTGKLADPAASSSTTPKPRLVAQSTPVYYITGTIHSPETGAPTALMELAYRLAVDDSPYIAKSVTASSPSSPCRRSRWPRPHGRSLTAGTSPIRRISIRRSLLGQVRSHDNNRDAMGVTLKLTENVLNTYVGWKAQVLHDLHESVPYLYDNTAGDGPFNAWVDPILTDEWEIDRLAHART